MPTRRGRNQLEQASGHDPAAREDEAEAARSVEASRMSIGSSMVAPMPTAGPLTAAITGLRQAKMRKASRPPPSRAASWARSIAPSAAPARAATSKARRPRRDRRRRRTPGRHR